MAAPAAFGPPRAAEATVGALRLRCRDLLRPDQHRYATGTTNMQVYSLHNPCRYVFVAADGPVILFEFKGCEHLSADCPAVDEVRRAVSWYHFITGPRTL